MLLRRYHWLSLLILPGFAHADTLTATDTVWIAIAAALVFFMQVGFALLEVGSVSIRNTKNTLFKNLLDVCCGAATFFLVGYGLAYGEGNGFAGASAATVGGVRLLELMPHRAERARLLGVRLLGGGGGVGELLAVLHNLDRHRFERLRLGVGVEGGGGAPLARLVHSSDGGEGAVEDARLVVGERRERRARPRLRLGGRREREKLRELLVCVLHLCKTGR